MAMRARCGPDGHRSTLVSVHVGWCCGAIVEQRGDRTVQDGALLVGRCHGLSCRRPCEVSARSRAGVGDRRLDPAASPPSADCGARVCATGWYEPVSRTL
jgi:hypothetical protein